MGNFINFSNHSSQKWDEKQIVCAKRYGNIIDVNFPEVACDAIEEQIEQLAKQYVSQIMNLDPSVVMCQGEFTLTYAIVSKLLSQGIPCVAACSRRETVEEIMPDGSSVKKSKFCFEKFRFYQ